MTKVLIADDIEQNRYLLEALLTGHGYEVLSATNGAEALDIARAEPVDLVVTDILMPVMDGFTLCREWKNDANLKKVPFIFFTATYTDDKDADFGLSLGADRFLVKPMEPDEIMTAIEETLRQNGRTLDPAEALPEEGVYLQQYNQALIRKLEDKMLQLEDANRQLEAEVQVRRRTEAQLLRFKTAIENTAESIILTDTKGEIEYVNSAFEKNTGYSSKEVLGKNPSILKSGRHDKAFYRQMWDTILAGQNWQGHLTNKTKAGKITEVEATISPIPDEVGRLSGFVSVMRDVTRQMAMEKQLVQSQKMEAIGTLAGGIAHDFNNILGAIIGYTQIALFDCPSTGKVAQSLNSVLEACDRAKNLVQQILTFSRKTERERIPVDLVPIIKESQKFLRASIPSTIEIRIELETVSGFVEADPIQLQQVILNLCTNAVYAMRDTGGILVIRLKRMELDHITARNYTNLKPGRHLLLSICDSGCGMDKETVQRIFEPFYTTKERGEGTGLGLSVAHGIVQSHNGLIDVYSEQGNGTTFNVYFPEAQGEIKRTEDTGQINLPGGNEHILFVDDESALVDVGQELLKTLGYKVTTALSGREALEKFTSAPQSFDLIITDQTMPHMTGTDLANEIKKIRPEIPVVVCTGFSAFDSEAKAQAAGITRLMTKPLEFRELAHAVRTLLDEKSNPDQMDLENPPASL
jgi:PAS domain S-box-containing protein